VPPASTAPAATGDPTRADALPSSGMFASEDLEESSLAEPFTLELDALDLPTEFMSGPFAAAEHTPPQEDTAPQGVPIEADPEFVLSSFEALSVEEHDATTQPGHLTIELDASALPADVSSITPDEPQLAHAPGDVPSPAPPPANPIDDEEALILDLDDLEFDDEERA